ncbi:MAG: serine/threonine-protein kinase [Clostridia bacterium]|nr:serine/threonine-protein kinase [Clostridia bacterium]
MEKVIANRYKLIKPLDNGGLKRIYLARDEALGRQVVLTHLGNTPDDDIEFCENFRREGTILTGFSHPNLVKIYDYLLDNDDLYLLTEYLDGFTLKKLHRINKVKALKLILQVCQGLEYAHRNQVIHGNLHPGNLVVVNNKVKVTGFGTTALEGYENLYSPPEKRQGLELDERSDIFSLGVILHELLTGKIPVAGALDEGLTEDYIPVLAKCLAAAPDKRFNSIRELMSWLYKLHERESHNHLGRWQENIKKVPPFLAAHRDIFIKITSVLLMTLLTYRWLDILGGYQVITARTIPFIIGLVTGIRPVLGIWLFWLVVWPPLWKLSKSLAILEIGALVTLGRFINRYPKQLAMLLFIPAIPDIGILLPFIGAVLWGSRSGFVLGIWACMLTELGQLIQVSPVIGFIRLIPAEWTNQGLAGLDWWQVIKTMANPLYWFWQPLIWGSSAYLVGLLAHKKTTTSWSMALPALAGVMILISGYGLITVYLQVNTLATVSLGAAATTAGLLCILIIFLKKLFQQV